MKGNSYRAGIDIGGTKVNIGILRDNGEILTSGVISSEGAKETDAFVDRICTVLEKQAAALQITLDDISHIGVGIPGTADTERGVVEFSCNLFGEECLNLGECFRSRLGKPVTVVQDSWAAAWAEHLFGAGKDVNNMLCVTIGTGIGCGVVLDGRVFGGAMHTAGEIGHTPIVWNGRLCSCGRKGCLETYASGTAILKQALERFPEKLENIPKKTESVFELAYAGDEDALTLLDECVDKLAYGIAVAIDLLSVNTIIISGGISVHDKLIIQPLADRILKWGYPSWTSRAHLHVSAAALGSDAPMVGAAFLTLQDMLLAGQPNG